jgi:hypothetical protein
MRIGLDLGPQRGHPTIDAARRHDHGVAPHGIEDIAASERAAHAAGEIGEQAELFRGERYLLAAPGKYVRGEVQLEIAEATEEALCRVL